MSDTSLPDPVKTFIVQSLACWDSPSTVAKAVKDQFGETISRQAVQYYDPTKVAGATLAEEWRTLFERTRAAFLDDQASIGVAHRVTRLRRLEGLIDKAEAQGNVALAAQLLAQVAKEVGDVFTNRQRIDANHTVRSHEDALGDLE